MKLSEKDFEVIYSKLASIREVLAKKQIPEDNFSGIRRISGLLELYLKLMSQVLVIEERKFEIEFKREKLKQALEELIKSMIQDVFSVLESEEMDSYQRDKIVEAIKEKFKVRISDFSEKLKI